MGVAFEYHVPDGNNIHSLCDHSQIWFAVSLLRFGDFISIFLGFLFLDYNAVVSKSSLSFQSFFFVR